MVVSCDHEVVLVQRDRSSVATRKDLDALKLAYLKKIALQKGRASNGNVEARIRNTGFIKGVIV